MGSLFSSKQDNKNKRKNDTNNGVTEKDRAILDLKNARDKLKRYRKKVKITYHLNSKCMIDFKLI